MSTYKKSYDGDYTKSYQQSLDWQSQNKKDIAEYLKVSKKIASQQYNKNPFSNNYIISNNPLGSNNTEKVLANGASSNISNKKKKKSTTSTSEQQTKVEQTTRKPVNSTTEKKTPTNNQSVGRNKNNSTQTTSNTRINSNSNSYQNTTNSNNATIVVLGNGNFLNGKTKKQISENEAREILRNNGFKSISTFKINWTIIIFVLIFIVNIFPSAALIASAVIFFKLLNAKNVTWTKGRESYSIKASTEEMKTYRKYTFVALIVAILSAIKLFF